jgi:hypothetical protein
VIAVVVIFWLLKAKGKGEEKLIALRAKKSDKYCYCNSWMSNNYKKRNEEKKQRTITFQ